MVTMAAFHVFENSSREMEAVKYKTEVKPRYIKLQCWRSNIYNMILPTG